MTLPTDDAPRPNCSASELLAALVSIESINPVLDAEGAGERALAALVERWCVSVGLVVDRHDPDPMRPSLVVRPPVSGTGPTLLLCGHLDTVGATGVDRPFEPRVDGDRLYGRGAYDMKAGLAAALVTVRDAARLGLSGQVILAAVADEEHSSLGLEVVLPHLQADAAIVTEPTDMALGVAHRGFLWADLVFHGKAAHGSRPHLGVDAIMHAGRFLAALERLNARLATRRHPLLDAPQWHASLIAGGREESTIPDECRLTIERRLLPGEDEVYVSGELEGLLTSCRTAAHTFNATSTIRFARMALESDPSAGAAPSLQRAAARVTGRALNEVGLSYWADSGLLAGHGIPTVLLGPAGAGAHAAHEWVSLSSTATCSDVLLNAATDFCR